MNFLSLSLISRLALATAIGMTPVAVFAQTDGRAVSSEPASATPVPTEAAARADALLARMTRDEKLQLIHGYFPPMAAQTPGAPVAKSPGSE